MNTKSQSYQYQLSLSRSLRSSKELSRSSSAKNWAKYFFFFIKKKVFYKQHFISEIIKPLSVDKLFDLLVKKLSGGELQRTALVLALGKSANVYLIDEPSAYLDSEQRIIASKIIKRFTINSNKSAFVVEHDFIMATYLADRVIVHDGEPAKECVARNPVPLLEGMNKFLKLMNITFRRDPTNYRPRINKQGSVKDQEQKKSGKYFIVDDD